MKHVFGQKRARVLILGKTMYHAGLYSTSKNKALSCLRCVGNSMSKKTHYIRVPGVLHNSYTYVEKLRANPEYSSKYSTDVQSFLHLARLEFIFKTRCVPHYFLYNEVASFVFPQNFSPKFLMIKFLTSVAYCSPTCTLYKLAHRIIYMHTPEFQRYHTAVMLLSDLDFVVHNNEHIPGSLHEVTSFP